MDSAKKVILRRFLYAALIVAAALPLACDYVMEGGEVLLWLARVEEIRVDLTMGRFSLFPSMELIAAYEGQLTAMDSNLWLLAPAFLRAMGVSITEVYRIFMLGIALGTVFAARWMFEGLFENRDTALFGALFYVTCPYRIYICYDKGNLGQAVVWMLIPVLARGLLGAAAGRNREIKPAGRNREVKPAGRNREVKPAGRNREVKPAGRNREIKPAGRNRIVELLAAGAALAGIGYASSVTAVILAGLIAAATFFTRRLVLLLPVLAGLAAAFPGLGRMLRYVMWGGMEEWNISVQTISGKGYAIGQIFNIYTWQENLPGLGLALAAALLLLFWLQFIGEGGKMPGRVRLFMGIGLLCVLMSFEWFPWDLAQRLGGPFYRLIPLFGTPGIFFGIGCMALSVPAAFAAGKIMESPAAPVRVGGTVLLACAAAGVALYLCNVLTYSRIPLFLTDMLP